MENLIEKNIGEIVAEDYRTAAVFQFYGIDFCCNGNRKLADACKAKNIATEKVKVDIEAIKNLPVRDSNNYDSWPIDFLAEYIEQKHHRYVSEKIPVIVSYLEKICKVHGKQHSELYKIKDLFSESVGELTMHMKKEELILFPFVKKMMKNAGNKESMSKPHFGTVQHPVQAMMHEHDTEGERFRQIATLSHNYTPPADACNTYKVTYSLLKEFEEDLHLHIHLENNILFPKAIEKEKELSS